MEMDHEVVFEGLSGLNSVEMLAEATDILVAGSDTTATTLAVAVNQLASHPERYDALKQEIRQAQLQTEEDFDLKVIERLPYLVSKGMGLFNLYIQY